MSEAICNGARHDLEASLDRPAVHVGFEAGCCPVEGLLELPSLVGQLGQPLGGRVGLAGCQQLSSERWVEGKTVSVRGGEKLHLGVV